MTLLIVCDFLENRRREGRTILEAFMKLHVPLCCENTYFKITESPGEVYVLPVRYGLHHL